MKKYIYIIFLIGASLYSQTVSSQFKILDSQGEGVIGALISINGSAVTVSDSNGVCQVRAKLSAFYVIQVSAMSFKTWLSDTLTELPKSIEITLKDDALQLQQVTIIEKSNKSDQVIGTVSIDAKDFKMLPSYLGEVDVLKVLLLKPGIQNGGEGSNGIFVRGGGADQNLILLDDAPIYNANHLFGFFSIFNSDIVQSVDVYKGSFDSKYGGRLSSIIDVGIKNGKKDKVGGVASLGLISSKLALELPIQKNRSSLIVAARRTYVEIFTRPINKANESNEDFDKIPDYFFYDLNAKADYVVSKNTKLFISTYYGRDNFSFAQNLFKINFNWGNKAATLKMVRTLGSKLTMQLSLIGSGYDYQIRNQITNFSFTLSSAVREYQSKVDWDYSPNSKSKVSFGTSLISRKFTIGRIDGGSEADSVSINAGSNKSAEEYSIHGQWLNRWGSRWLTIFGLRPSLNINGHQRYVHIDPRLSLQYSFSSNTKAKAAFSGMYQYVNLISNTGASLPTDIWYPSTKAVRPQISYQTSAGVELNTVDKNYVLSVEWYYKWLLNQIDYKDGARLFVNNNLENEFVFGKGYAYGQEFYLQKKNGKTTGWLSYTLSWSWRQFNEINSGSWFHPRNDKRHDINLVLMHKINNRWQASVAFVFATGNLTTVPIGKTIFQGQNGVQYLLAPDYGDRNNYRMAPYHRLDLALNYAFLTFKKESSITFGVYNAYNRRNPYFVYFEERTSPKNEDIIIGFKGTQVSLFPILPSISYTLKF